MRDWMSRVTPGRGWDTLKEIGTGSDETVGVGMVRGVFGLMRRGLFFMPSG